MLDPKTLSEGFERSPLNQTSTLYPTPFFEAIEALALEASRNLSLKVWFGPKGPCAQLVYTLAVALK